MSIFEPNPDHHINTVAAWLRPDELRLFYALICPDIMSSTKAEVVLREHQDPNGGRRKGTTRARLTPEQQARQTAASAVLYDRLAASRFVLDTLVRLSNERHMAAIDQGHAPEFTAEKDSGPPCICCGTPSAFGLPVCSKAGCYFYWKKGVKTADAR